MTELLMRVGNKELTYNLPLDICLTICYYMNVHVNDNVF
jgi:hypothetical protein